MSKKSIPCLRYFRFILLSCFWRYFAPRCDVPVSTSHFNTSPVLLFAIPVLMYLVTTLSRFSTCHTLMLLQFNCHCDLSMYSLNCVPSGRKHCTPQFYVSTMIHKRKSHAEKVTAYCPPVLNCNITSSRKKK